MSLRKAKKILEQKKAVETKNIKQEQQQQSEEEQQYNKKPASNMFEMFGEDNSEQQQQIKQDKEENTEEVEKVEKIKDKKKNKKKKKKSKQKGEQQKKQQQLEEEDVQKIFKQCGMQYKGKQQEEQYNHEEWESVLNISVAKFNYQKELRRHFGNTGEMNQDRDNDPQLNKKQQKMQKHLRKMMKKSVLSPGVKEYVLIHEKFDMEREEDKIKFMPTKKYEHYQIQYESVRNTNDINALFMFSQTHPEHVDSLYAVGQFLRLQGNYRDADALIQRVIYIYEMAGGYDLMQFTKTDIVKKQIVYDTYSTSLFMALFKFMDILGKKGCYRAALQYNKFLLKINTDDPTACLLSIDYNAVSSKNYQYLLTFVKYYSQYLGQSNANLYLLPNFAYSVALARFHIEIEGNQKQKQLLVEQNNISKLLKFTMQDWKKALILPDSCSYAEQSPQCLILRAIVVYPSLINQIAHNNQYSKQFLNHQILQGNQAKPFKQILAHEFWQIIPTSYSYHFLKLDSQSDSKGLDKVLQVYVERSKILWKSKQLMLFVKAAMGFVLNIIDSKQFSYQEFLQRMCTQQSGGQPIPFNLKGYEHISKANFSDRVDRIDLANIQDNQQMHQNQNRMSLEGNPLSLFLRSLLPWNNLPEQGQMGQFDPDMPDIQDDNE